MKWTKSYSFHLHLNKRKAKIWLDNSQVGASFSVLVFVWPSVCQATQVKGIIYSPDYNFISGNTKESSKARRRQPSTSLRAMWLQWLSGGAAGCASPNILAGSRGRSWSRTCRGKSSACPNKLAGWQKSIVPIIIMRLLTYWTTKRSAQKASKSFSFLSRLSR